MFKPIENYKFIAITLIDISYESLCDKVMESLTELSEWSAATGALDIRSVLHEGQTMSGNVNRKIVIWPVKNNKTVFLSNKTDGSSTMIYSLHLPNDLINVRVSRPDIVTMNEFEFNRNGETRIVLSYWDSDKWVFYEKGELLPFENQEYYKRRLKKEKINFNIINEYLEVNGWLLNDDSFWESNDATYFTESFPNLENNW